MSIALGVNIDHIATLRQVRGGTTSYPDLYRLTNLVIGAGADQITLHLREDRRHIQPQDVEVICKNRRVPVNLEMAATAQMLKVALKHKPDWCCFVPEKREELTTEGGLNVAKAAETIAPMVERLSRIGIDCSMFIEPSIKQVKAAYQVGAAAVEFHTGKWVHLKGQNKTKEWNRLREAALLAHSLGMFVHAGHGLDFNTTKEICKLPNLREVNIGHSLICYSLELGIEKAVQEMKKQIALGIKGV